MSRTRRRSPEVRSTAFTARPPDLPPRLLMAVDFAITCSLVQPGRPRYPVLVHQAAALLRASFRPRLAAAPLRFANPSPPSGWIEDFHLQALDHARHTRKAPPKRGDRTPEEGQRSRRSSLLNHDSRQCPPRPTALALSPARRMMPPCPPCVLSLYPPFCFAEHQRAALRPKGLTTMTLSAMTERL